MSVSFIFKESWKCNEAVFWLKQTKPFLQKSCVFHLAIVKLTFVHLSNVLVYWLLIAYAFVAVRCGDYFLSQVVSFLPHESSVFVFCRSKSSQRLTSHDVHSNVYNYKSTFSVEIVPICKVASFCFISRGYSMKWVVWLC